MASASLLKSSPVLDKSEFLKGQSLLRSSTASFRAHTASPSTLVVRAASSYADELVKTAVPFRLSPSPSPFHTMQSGLVPLAGSNDESWCQGLDGLASRSAAYYQQGARFAKWRTVVSIPNGPSALAVKEAAWGLARYAAISQDNGLVPIVEPEILLDGDHGIDRTFEVAKKVWAEVFFYLAENNVTFEGILLKPSMVTPGAECKDRATPEQVAAYTLKLLHNRIPPAVPGIMFLSGGQSEVEATLNLNAMNQGPNPWHVSFSYARALQNTCLKTWGGRPENVKAAQDALLLRAKANSLAQLGKYTGEGETEESKQGMFVKGYVY
ncbi:Fructose-bisphosphate aldolase [Nymphaea thermarum]|nr:Fructose-bisphosphate aldolase [Nymphaea thermarum]